MSRNIATAVAVAAGILLTAPSAALADWTACKQLTDVNLRLLCYDEMAKDAGADTNTEVKTPNTQTTDAKTSAQDSKDFKTAEPEDIYIAPRKYVDKPIEIRNVSCLYVDVEDYRCSTPANVTIFAKAVTPDSVKSSFEEACGSMKKLLSKSCRKIIRLIPSEYSEDEINGNQKRVILRAESIEILPDSAAGKKKR